MNNLAGQRKAIIAGVIAGLTFFYTNVPDPDAAVRLEWLRFVGELLTVTLGAYYAVWVAPNEAAPDPREDAFRELIGQNNDG